MFEKTPMIVPVSFFKKYSLLISLFSLLLAMGAIFWFGIMPLKQSLDNKLRGIQEFYAGQENQEKQIKKLPELKNQYDVIIENESKLDILLSEDQIVDFIKTLEGLAKEMDVQMTITSKENGQIIEPKKVVTKAVPLDGDTTAATEKNTTKPKVVSILEDVPFDRYLRLSLNVGGQYSNIISFLRKIETLPVGLDIVGVEIKKTDATTETQTNTSGTSSNPFSFLGSGTIETQVQPQVIKKNLLEATFDVLVYVNK